eukprot:m.218044 g.218044  ORF g.218044 m.218044 type:complete len:3593 (-) comp10156_c0_seq3:222-11000(-)
MASGRDSAFGGLRNNAMLPDGKRYIEEAFVGWSKGYPYVHTVWSIFASWSDACTDNLKHERVAKELAELVLHTCGHLGTLLQSMGMAHKVGPAILTVFRLTSIMEAIRDRTPPKRQREVQSKFATTLFPLNSQLYDFLERALYGDLTGEYLSQQLVAGSSDIAQHLRSHVHVALAGLQRKEPLWSTLHDERMTLLFIVLHGCVPDQDGAPCMRFLFSGRPIMEILRPIRKHARLIRALDPQGVALQAAHLTIAGTGAIISPSDFEYLLRLLLSTLPSSAFLDLLKALKASLREYTCLKPWYKVLTESRYFMDGNEEHRRHCITHFMLQIASGLEHATPETFIAIMNDNFIQTARVGDIFRTAARGYLSNVEILLKWRPATLLRVLRDCDLVGMEAEPGTHLMDVTTLLDYCQRYTRLSPMPPTSFQEVVDLTAFVFSASTVNADSVRESLNGALIRLFPPLELAVSLLVPMDLNSDETTFANMLTAILGFGPKYLELLGDLILRDKFLHDQLHRHAFMCWYVNLSALNDKAVALWPSVIMTEASAVVITAAENSYAEVNGALPPVYWTWCQFGAEILFKRLEDMNRSRPERVKDICNVYVDGVLPFIGTGKKSLFSLLTFGPLKLSFLPFNAFLMSLVNCLIRKVSEIYSAPGRAKMMSSSIKVLYQIHGLPTSNVSPPDVGRACQSKYNELREAVENLAYMCLQFQQQWVDEQVTIQDANLIVRAENRALCKDLIDVWLLSADVLGQPGIVIKSVADLQARAAHVQDRREKMAKLERLHEWMAHRNVALVSEIEVDLVIKEDLVVTDLENRCMLADDVLTRRLGRAYPMLLALLGESTRCLLFDALLSRALEEVEGGRRSIETNVLVDAIDHICRTIQSVFDHKMLEPSKLLAGLKLFSDVANQMTGQKLRENLKMLMPWLNMAETTDDILDNRIGQTSAIIQILKAESLWGPLLQCVQVYNLRCDHGRLRDVQEQLRAMHTSQAVGSLADLLHEVQVGVYDLSLDDMHFFGVLLDCEPLVSFLRTQTDVEFDKRLQTATAMLQGDEFAQGILTGLAESKQLLDPVLRQQTSLQRLCDHIQEVKRSGEQRNIEQPIDRAIQKLRSCMEQLPTIQRFMADTSGASIESVLLTIKHIRTNQGVFTSRCDRLNAEISLTYRAGGDKEHTLHEDQVQDLRRGAMLSIKDETAATTTDAQATRERNATLREFDSLCDLAQGAHRLRVHLKKRGHPMYQTSTEQFALTGPTPLPALARRVQELEDEQLAWDGQVIDTLRLCPRLHCLHRMQLVSVMQALQTLLDKRGDAAAAAACATWLLPSVALCFPEKLATNTLAPLGLRNICPTDGIDAALEGALTMPCLTPEHLTEVITGCLGELGKANSADLLLQFAANIVNVIGEFLQTLPLEPLADGDDSDDFIRLAEVSRVVRVPGPGATATYCAIRTLVDQTAFVTLMPWQCLTCTPLTTSEEIDDFIAIKRVFTSAKFFVDGANRLLPPVRGHLLELFSTIKVVKDSAELYIVFSDASPGDIVGFGSLREEGDLGEVKNIREQYCKADANKDYRPMLVRANIGSFVCVTGGAGQGKTWYIEKALKACEPVMTLSVNENFSPYLLIHKLERIISQLGQHGDVTDLGIHVNISPHVLPSLYVESAGPEAMRSRTTPLDRLAAMLDEFVFMGTLSDPEGGVVLRIPDRFKFHFYFEIPFVNDEQPAEMLTLLPVLDLFCRSSMVAIDPATPYHVDDDVTLVALTLRNLHQGDLRAMDFKTPAATQISADEALEHLTVLFKTDVMKGVLKNKLFQRCFVALLAKRCRDLERTIEYLVTNQCGDDNCINEYLKRLFPFLTRECRQMCDQSIVGDFSLYEPIFTSRGRDGFVQLLVMRGSEADARAIVQNTSFNWFNSQDPDIGLRAGDLRSFIGAALGIENLLPLIERTGFVMTPDIALKLVLINELRLVSDNIIIQGGTGCGKTELMNMYSLMLNADSALMPNLLDELRAIVCQHMPEAGSVEHAGSVEAVCHAIMEACEDLENGESRRLRWLPLLVHEVERLHGRFKLLKQAPIVEMFLREYKKPGFTFTTKGMQDFIMAAFTARLCDIFERILMSERVTATEWRTTIKTIDRKARKLAGLDRDAKLVVFVDELDTCNILGLVKEVFVDRRIDGDPLQPNIFFVGAINPAGRGGQAPGATINYTGVAANIVKQDFIVKQLCPSLQSLIIDFGALQKTQETAFLSSLLQDPAISVDKMFAASEARAANAPAAANNPQIAAAASAVPPRREVLAQRLLQLRDVVLFCQDFVRRHRDMGAIESRVHVSIRDIMRAVRLYLYFKNPELKEPIVKVTSMEPDARHWHAMLMAIALTYYFRLPTKYTGPNGREFHTRQLFEEQLRKQLVHLRAPQDYVSVGRLSALQISNFFTEIHLPVGIARTRAVMEHMYAIAVCTETKIPLIITGPPGCSKTLSFNTAEENMRGSGSRNNIFFKLKKISRFNYHCSEESTGKDLEAVAMDAINRQGAILHVRHYAEQVVMFLDEAGLPLERKQALKGLHLHLDHPRIAYVILTNTTLDAAKTNRAMLIMQMGTSEEDLLTLARGCLCGEAQPSPRMRNIVAGLCTGFLHANDPQFLEGLPVMDSRDPSQPLAPSVRPGQQPFAADEAQSLPSARHLFHIRDFVYLLRYLRKRGGGSGVHGDVVVTSKLILDGLRRNFNGLLPRQFSALVGMFLGNCQLDPLSEDPLPCTLHTLTEALCDRVKPGENPSHSAFRHILLIDPTNCQAAAEILFSGAVPLHDGRKTVVCTVSDFVEDANERERSQRVSEIKAAMQRGDRVVMINASSIYSSFYDVFNKHFSAVSKGDDAITYFANISIGPYSRPAEVHPDFQVVVVIPMAELARTSLPFLHRFEKYIVGINDLVIEMSLKQSENYRTAIQTLGDQCNQFISLMGPASFVGLAPDETVASILLPALLDAEKRNQGVDGLQDMDLPVIMAPFRIDKDDPARPPPPPELPARTLAPEQQMAAMIQAINFKVLQLMRPEAIFMLRNRNPLGNKLIFEYIHRQEHFSLLLALEAFIARPADAAATNKLIAFTRTSSHLAEVAQSEPMQRTGLQPRIVLLALSSVCSSTACDLAVREFMESATKDVLLVIANLSEVSSSQLNYVKRLIDSKLVPGKRAAIVAHFAPEAVLSGSSWDFVFLGGWEAIYCDGGGRVDEDLLSSFKESYQADLELSRSERDAARADAQALGLRMRESAARLHSALKAVSELEARLQNISHENRTLSVDLQAVRDENTTLSANFKTATAARDSALAGLQALGSEHEVVRADLRAATRARDEIEISLRETSSELQATRLERDNALSDLTSVSQDRDQARQDFTASRTALAALQEAHGKVEIEAAFLASFTNTYHNTIKFQIINIDVLVPSATQRDRFNGAQAALLAQGCKDKEIEERLMYHSTQADSVQGISVLGLKPAECEACRTSVYVQHDAGWYGKHSKGVYVSKHADYTFRYALPPGREPAHVIIGDYGTTVVLKVVTGRVRHFHTPRGPIEPTPGYHSHEGTEHLEHFIFDPAQTLPVAVVHWRAIMTTRAGILHAGIDAALCPACNSPKSP